MSRYCPACNRSLSFEHFLSAATNSDRQWTCQDCGHVLKKDMSSFFSAFVLFMMHFVLLFGAFGFLLRVRHPLHPELVMWGVTKGTAFLIAFGIIIASASTGMLIFRHLFRVTKFDQFPPA